MTNTANLELTPLERDLLDRFYQRYADLAFPSTDQVAVKSRSNTGAGRYTYLDHDGAVQLENGQLGLGTYSQINMVGLDAGASFWVYVENRNVLYLEIAVNGNQYWDGTESNWVVCDPDTGDFPPDVQER